MIRSNQRVTRGGIGSREYKLGAILLDFADVQILAIEVAYGIYVLKQRNDPRSAEYRKDALLSEN